MKKVYKISEIPFAANFAPCTTYPGTVVIQYIDHYKIYPVTSSVSLTTLTQLKGPERNNYTRLKMNIRAQLKIPMGKPIIKTTTSYKLTQNIINVLNLITCSCCYV